MNHLPININEAADLPTDTPTDVIDWFADQTTPPDSQDTDDGDSDGNEGDDKNALTKADLIVLLAEKARLQNKQAEGVVNMVFDMMTACLKRGDRIEIRGFGSFVNRSYESYQGRNPKTGEIVKVPPKKVPFFKVGKELKELVDRSKK